MNSNEVLEFARNNGAKQLDMRFTDIPGLQHHISYPIGELNAEFVRRGLRHRRIEHSRLGGDQ